MGAKLGVFSLVLSVEEITTVTYFTVMGVVFTCTVCLTGNRDETSVYQPLRVCGVVIGYNFASEVYAVRVLGTSALSHVVW